MGNAFDHDDYMIQLSESLVLGDSENQQSQTSDESAFGEDKDMPNISSSTVPAREALPPEEEKSPSQITAAPLLDCISETADEPTLPEPAQGHQELIDLTNDSNHSQSALEHRNMSRPSKRPFENCAQSQQSSMEDNQKSDTRTDDTTARVVYQGIPLSAGSLETRHSAFNTMFGESGGDYVWDGLISTTNNHTHPETELGED